MKRKYAPIMGAVQEAAEVNEYSMDTKMWSRPLTILVIDDHDGKTQYAGYEGHDHNVQKGELMYLAVDESECVTMLDSRNPHQLLRKLTSETVPGSPFFIWGETPIRTIKSAYVFHPREINQPHTKAA